MRGSKAWRRSSNPWPASGPRSDGSRLPNPRFGEGDGAETELLWWEQPFQGAAEAKAWVGAPRSAWEYAGGQTLRAAGLETVETAEARNTWLEILSQSLSVMARAAGSILGREVVCAGGGERPPGPEVVDFARVWLKFSATSLDPLTLALNPRMLDLWPLPPAQTPSRRRAGRPRRNAAASQGELANPGPASRCRVARQHLVREEGDSHERRPEADHRVDHRAGPRR